MVSFDRIIKLTNCKVKSRRIDFSGTKYGSLLNTQEKISNRLLNRFILAKLVHRNSYLMGCLGYLIGLRWGNDRVMMPIHDSS